ncbi:MAG: site-2 protease family protein [Candidatus Liptonbacteria bacterium]|nr:site-2 protease family protein [Candidatus Liptonbacteria bacterium]
MLIFILVIFGLAFLILSHEAGHFFAAKAFGLKVDEFGFGFPPRIFAKKIGETEYSLNWLPFGGFVKIVGENDAAPFVEGEEAAPEISAEEKKHLFAFQPLWKRSIVMLAGVTVNFLIGWFLISAVLMVGTPKALIINEVQNGTPAEHVGLLAGDIIKNFDNAKSFISFVNAHRGEQINIEIIREGNDMNFNVVPRINVGPGEGPVGIALADAGSAREGFASALWTGLKDSVAILGFTFQAFYALIVELFTHASLLPGVVGPVGIFSVAQTTGKIGFIYLVQLVSIISLNLTVVNLIPFPALDGGRFLMIIIEKIKGSPIPRGVERWVNAAGFAFLIVLMVLLTVRDVGHLL